MADIICLGELLIDFVPTVTGLGLADAELFKKAAGGAPANVAVGVARLGVTSGFMGMVGEDGFGRFLADTLAGAGVDVGQLRFTEAAHTTLAFVGLHPDGEREFLFYRSPGADLLFAPADIDEAAIGRAKLLHFGSLSLTAEPARAATLHAVATARRHGKRVSYDPNLRLALWEDEAAARAGLLLGLQHADIVKIGDEEVEFLTGIKDPIAGARVAVAPRAGGDGGDARVEGLPVGHPRCLGRGRGLQGGRGGHDRRRRRLHGGVAGRAGHLAAGPP